MLDPFDIWLPLSTDAPLVEIGDLEIVADLLSIDAVRIKPGALVRIDGWGGSSILEVSALGIEGQRVRTVIFF